MAAGTIIVTACDVHHYDLATDLLASLTVIPDRWFSTGFVQIGADEPPAAVRAGADLVARIDKTAGGPGAEEGFWVAHLAIKARLPELFPGFDCYIWLDGDTWVQNALGLRQIDEGARLADVCIAPSLDVNYLGNPVPDHYTIMVYNRLYGPEAANQFARLPMLNAGVFAAMSASPLWTAWRSEMEAAWARQAGQADRFYSDQIPLHRLIGSGRLSVLPLRAVNNWQAHLCLPRIDFERKLLTMPTFPHEELHIIHLVGATKHQSFKLDPRHPEICLRYSAVMTLFAE
jgi:hypothetical protein